MQRESPGQREALLCFHQPPVSAPLSGDLPPARAAGEPAGGCHVPLGQTQAVLLSHVLLPLKHKPTQSLRAAGPGQLRPPLLCEPLRVDLHY